jgi:hypothetical protein
MERGQRAEKGGRGSQVLSYESKLAYIIKDQWS